MGHTRVIYTDSTSAECGTVLKMLNFEEDAKNGWHVQPDDLTIKVYVVWGKAPYYPEILENLPFAPRVQVHFKTRENLDRLDFFTREAVVALQNLDPTSRIKIFDANSGTEILS